MKSVLISIQPYWVFLIIAKMMGWNVPQEKTIEVRKTFPTADNWNKVAKIYCSKDKRSFSRIPKEYRPMMERFLGKVLGEFVCDTFVVDKTFGHDPLFLAAACMGEVEAAAYCTNPEMYGWHISELKFYDEPKELRKLIRVCSEWEKEEITPKCHKCDHYFTSWAECYAGCDCDGELPVTRPPQSWCYVEEAG